MSKIKSIGEFDETLTAPAAVKKVIRYGLLSPETDVVMGIINAYHAECKVKKIKPLAVNDCFQIIFNQLVRNMFKPNTVIELVNAVGQKWKVDLNNFTGVEDFNFNVADIEDATAPESKTGRLAEDQSEPDAGQDADTNSGADGSGQNSQRQLTEEEELAELERELAESNNQ
ncbi:hypothetical protein ACSQ5K_26540 [Pseudomonas sp. PhalM4]